MYRRILRRCKGSHIKKGSFTAHVLTLLTGTTIAQSIPLAAAPILTRLYSPDDFGVFSLFTSFASIFAIIATARYEMAIVLPENDEDAINIAALSLCISIVISVFLFGVVYLYKEQIESALNNKNMSPWLYWLPLSVFVSGVVQALNFWNSRRKKFKILSSNRINQSLITTVVNMLLGFSKIKLNGLIVGSLIGQAMSATMLVVNFFNSDKKILRQVNLGKIKYNAIKYRSFPIINTFHAFMDALQISGIIFLIATFYGNNTLGLFSLTNRVLKTPLNLIGSSVSQVFFQEASDAKNNLKNLHPLVLKITKRLAIIGFPIFVTTVMFSPKLFEFIFGKEWSDAGVYAQILSPWLYLNFIISPVSQIPIILNRQKKAFAIGLIYNLAIFSPLLILAENRVEINTALICVSMSACIVLCYYIFWIFRISNISQNEQSI